jgi:hypothetical protein
MRRPRHLCLQRQHPFDGLQYSEFFARQQQLPRQCGAIQFAISQ